MHACVNRSQINQGEISAQPHILKLSNTCYRNEESQNKCKLIIKLMYGAV